MLMEDGAAGHCCSLQALRDIIEQAAAPPRFQIERAKILQLGTRWIVVIEYFGGAADGRNERMQCCVAAIVRIFCVRGVGWARHRRRVAAGLRATGVIVRILSDHQIP